MKRILLLIILGFFTVHTLKAQIKTVNYNVVNNEINSNNPLPSEEPFFIRGILPKDIELVAVVLNRSGKDSQRGDEYSWKRAFDFEVSQYEVFVSNPLRSNEAYDLELFFYKRAEKEQMEAIKSSIDDNLESYIRANLEVTGGGIKTNNSNQVMITQMNQIVEDALEDYRHFLGRDFKGFSEIVRQKLEQKDRLKLKRARFNILGKNKEDNEKAAYADQYIGELIDIVQNESDQYLEESLLSLVDIRTVSNYPTERKPGTLPLNIGYGSIPIKRSLASTEYLHGPYAGLSIPLGNRTFTKFLGNASFSTGVFLQNFESSQGDQIEGQIIGLPIYAGLGYKIFRVFRFNVGAVSLNMDNGAGVSQHHIQPFAGISLEFNIWMGLNNRR
ncbi:hypothetical protein [Aquiflexum lacus]|uniref:hypothetical protein n=1 Tax=Aquiflexum lacus TaxID=2483805 RepID=UPI001892EBB5|nr:hypothetical protein [Aquiflexum lacus]